MSAYNQNLPLKVQIFWPYCHALLARRIKALLQKRSSLKVVRMMTQEQKRSLLIDLNE
jgi:hypothetical protein